MPSNRRRFLAISAGLAAGVAGCVADSPGAGDGDTPTTSPTDTDATDEPKGSPSATPTEPPTGAERTLGDATVAVTDVVARKAVVYESIMGSGGVVVGDGTQFVVASVHADAELSADAFAFRAGDEARSPSDPGDRGAYNRTVAGHEGGAVGNPYGESPRYVAFEVPSPLDAADPRIALKANGETAEWALPEEAVSTLAANAPAFELDSLDAPDSVEQGETMAVSLSATNTSETDGRFLAAVYWPSELVADDDESTVVEATVAAGESVTKTVEIDTAYTAYEDGPVTLEVDGHVEASTEVRVTNAGTET